MGWKRGFALQACSDFEAREVLMRDAALPQCHQLHFLQMAMGKTAKAQLVAHGADPMSVQSSHRYIAEVISQIVKEVLGQSGRRKSGGWMMDAARSLAAKISLLHPQIDPAGVPANCEYPWEDAKGAIIAPAEHDFGLNLLRERAAATMIKIVWERARELAAAEQ